MNELDLKREELRALLAQCEESFVELSDIYLECSEGSKEEEEIKQKIMQENKILSEIRSELNFIDLLIEKQTKLNLALSSNTPLGVLGTRTRGILLRK